MKPLLRVLSLIFPAVLCLLLMVSSTSWAQTETLLYSFSGGSDGSNPSALVHKGGKFFGTTETGGAFNFGTVFQITAKGKKTILHSFSGPDGEYPLGALVTDKKGNLYGGTQAGGAYNAGVVFVISPSGIASVLYSFTGGSDGSVALGPLIFDKAGNLYGVAGGGATEQGLIFKLSPSGIETVLYTFSGREDGGTPNGGLVFDPKGNIYGTTQAGGTGTQCFGGACGVVFELSPSGVEKVLHNFDGAVLDGFNPLSGLVRDKEGNLYGTTWLGGPNDLGIVYEVTPSGVETVLNFFVKGSSGYYPIAPLLLDKIGNLYGTASFSAYPTCSCGVVFQVPAANPYEELTVYRFQNEYHPDGAFPVTGLTWGTKGRLYGTTSQGGISNFGAVFELTP